MAWLSKIIDKDVQLAWIDKEKSIGVEREKNTQKLIIENNQKKNGIWAGIKYIPGILYIADKFK